MKYKYDKLTNENLKAKLLEHTTAKYTLRGIENPHEKALEKLRSFKPLKRKVWKHFQWKAMVAVDDERAKLGLSRIHG